MSYGITAAQTGKFSWSGLGKAALTGAVSGLAGGALGELPGAAAGSFAGDASSALDGLSGEAGDSGSLADSAAGEARAPAEEEPATSSCVGGNSFSAGTLVLLASGKTVPISQLKSGDTVLASDTKSGKDQPETVTAVMVHHDTDLYDLTVKTGHGTEVIHTTAGHLFWDPVRHQWVKAAALAKGESLQTPGSRATAYADGGTVPASHDGWMWDLTVPGNNDHDFYVEPAISGNHHSNDILPGNAAILVHNCGNAPRVFAVDSSGEATALPVHEIDSSLYPDVADNFNNALDNGESPIVTRLTGRSAIRANRADAQAGVPRPDTLGTDVQGDPLSWEEFPFASTEEGGAGATLRLINRDQNISHGRDSLWPFLRDNGIGNGDQYYVRAN